METNLFFHQKKSIFFQVDFNDNSHACTIPTKWQIEKAEVVFHIVHQ